MGLFKNLKTFFYAKIGSRVKVPTILQMEATECGAACLGMILAHYGLWVPLEKLRQECGVNRDGSKASCVIRAARNRHCKASGFRWNAYNLLEQISEKPFPLIIHWEFNHFVVLEGIKNGVAYLNDPGMGRRTVEWDRFVTSYTGIALQIRPDVGFVREGARYNVFKEIAKKLFLDKWALLFVILLGFFAIVPGLASPIFNQIFMDEIITGKHPEWVFSFFLAMTLSFLLTAAISFLRSIILTRWQRKLTLSDFSSYFWHMLRLPMQFFHQRYAAEVAGRVAYNESIAQVLSDSAATAVLDLMVAIFYLLLLLQYNVTLTLIGISFSAIGFIVLFAMRRHLTDLSMRIQQDAGKAYGVSMNGLRMIETIKANGDESDFFTKWAGYQTKVLAASQETTLWSMSMSLIPSLLGGVNGALIMTFGGFSIMDGAMTAGMFMAFQNLMNSFQAPVNKIMGLSSVLQTTEMQMQRLNDVKNYKIDSLNFPENENEKSFTKDRLSGELTISDLNFGYSPLEAPLLQNFNLNIGSGEWVAVVGSSGSGKSTLAKIVTGLYEEWSGKILFDGVERKNLPRAVILNSLAAVDQDIFLITGTIAENIALFDKSVRKSDIIQAAKDACIHEDIIKLEGGYEAMVSEGGLNFSGGQRQRLEIARALAINPSFLILDEATSALDPITEIKVLENIRHRGCSCLIIAHRLSTIRDCDEIIVLSYGKIVERGTHRDMVKHDGPYRKLIEEREQDK